MFQMRVVLLSAALLSGLATAAQAAFIESGSASFGPTPVGTVEYAVYQNDGTSGGNWAAQLSLAFGVPVLPTLAPLTDSGAIQLNAAYVYLYEVLIPNDPMNDVSELQVAGNVGEFSSYGNLSGIVFANPFGTAIGLGTGSTAFFAKIPMGTIAGNHYVNFVLDPTLNPPPTGAFQNSTLVFITSNDSPTMTLSGLHDGNTSFNFLPTPTPLPAGFVLLLSGLPGMIGVGLVRRRGKSQAGSN